MTWTEQLQRHRVLSALFGSYGRALVTLILGYILLQWAYGFLSWALWDSSLTATPRECLQSVQGACWSFIAEKHRLILFNIYPYEEHWRPLLATVLLISLVIVSTNSRFWGWQLIAIWAAGLALYALLMWGGVAGLSFVATAAWGGLPLTVLLAVFGLAIAFPLSIVLALGRRSDLPLVRFICVGYIELVRGVPLITVLFMASVLFPLFLPDGITVNQLLRALVGIALFVAAYLAEVIRGGLQAIPKGQYEAAQALGLSYWQSMRTVILPQALRLSIPPTVNIFIGTFKDTSLVMIVGLFDLFMATRAALADAVWRPFFIEAYVFVGVLYFVFCYAMSRYSKRLEATVGLKR